jgi:hypothetical protein
LLASLVGCSIMALSRASPPPTGAIEYWLMITVLTHKCYKCPFKHSKTMYVLTSGWLIVSVQIHSRKKKLSRGLKWPLQNGTSIPRRSMTCAILMQDLMKRGVCWCVGGDALRSLAFCSFQVLYSSSPKSHW